MRIHIPSDSGARALGADQVAAAVTALPADVEMIRNGSRGLYWLEPLLEVETDSGRLGFGPVTSADVPSIFTGDGVDEQHQKCVGPVDELPWLASQQRFTMARCGIIEPLNLDQYRHHGGFAGLANARSMSPRQIVDCVTDSGLRGRGGAAFPTGIKWRTVLESAGDTKYVVCNADEGDSGTFADRMLMECDPFVVIEGMLIGALAAGASRGYIYCRSEYPQAIDTLNQAIALAARAGYLQNFELEVRRAAGSYICGEETAMLESLEGKRGMVRYRPPLPAVEGLFGKPTLVNNVVSLAAVPEILAQGGASYQALGCARSRGTLTLQLAGNIRRGGLIEIPFGVSLRTILTDYGGGTRSGRPIKAVQAGGPLGAYIPPELFDTALDYEAFQAIGAMLGHGGLVVFDDTADLGQMARFAMHFCAEESCGKCTPCRIGAVRAVEVIDRIHENQDARGNRILLKDLCQTMIDGSLCALGGMAPAPVLSIMEHFPEEL